MNVKRVEITRHLENLNKIQTGLNMTIAFLVNTQILKYILLNPRYI